MLAIACQHVERPPFVSAARSRLADLDAYLADAPRDINLRVVVKKNQMDREAHGYVLEP
jgi:hypothetical protein